MAFGPAAANTVPATAAVFQGPCSIDPSLKEWNSLNIWSKATGMCVGPLSVKETFKIKGKPRTKLSGQIETLGIDRCQIENGSARGIRGFPTQEHRLKHLGPSTRILFFPIASPDTEVLRKPSKDYMPYFNFLQKWLHYINESGQKQTFKFEDNHFPLSFSIGDFRVAHYNDEGSRAFGTKFVKEVDPKYDFSNFDVVLVIPPAGTPRGFFEQGALGSHFVDGHQVIFMSVPPATFTTKFVPDFPMIAPAEWLHELYHVGEFSLQHHSGSDFWQNNRGTERSFPGLGEWGLMNMSKTDLLVWEKWIVGYLRDDQVACLDPNSPQKLWLIPSGVRAKGKKMAVIPLSPEKVIVLESVRAVGVNYKLPKQSEGLLVWTVDTAEPRETYGVEAIYPLDRKIKKDPFVLADAPLKRGEFVTVGNLKIKVIEAGPFGDVFAISK